VLYQLSYCGVAARIANGARVSKPYPSMRTWQSTGIALFPAKRYARFPVMTTLAAMDALPLTPPRLRECEDCGQVQTVPALPPATRAVCLRCDAVLRHTRRDPLTLPLALNVTAIVLFVIGAAMSMMTVSTAGQYHSASLLSGPAGLEQSGMWELSLVVLITTAAAPLARVLCMTAVLIGLRLPKPPREIRALYAWVEHLRPWSMLEIYLLGVFVAYVRLSAIVHIDLGIAIYALAALMLTMIAADVALDQQAVWEAMEAAGGRRQHSAGTLGRRLHRTGCPTCGMVSRAAPGALCPRCGFTLHARRRDSIARCWALSAAAAILYIPANIYPVLTVIRFGRGEPSTILGGVGELLDAGMWPLAALVFFASVAVPVLKLLGLGTLLITTQMGSRRRLRDRTVLYRIVDAIGRWSMIDIFMESILVALVQFGSVVTVRPGVGAIAFSAVVILTMLAARAFDPRLIWDRAGANL
jgi:paraquat-inducible protein A